VRIEIIDNRRKMKDATYLNTQFSLLQSQYSLLTSQYSVHNFVPLQKLKAMAFDKEKALEMCRRMCENTLMQTLNIEFTDAGEGFLEAKMPVNARVHQPMGLLHGGATVALAESVGSAASLLFINTDIQEVRGIEISANHLRAKRDGIVTGTARIIHQGRSLHLWEVRVTDENGKLISMCKITNMVMPRKR
jgi:1,4-dihydroxy-2-naphthoyl-CoA hydrolase